MKKMAIVGYRNSSNLGDALQMAAAVSLIGKDVSVIPRDNLRQVEGQGLTHFLINGWMSEHPQNFIFHESLNVLMTSIHISTIPVPYSKQTSLSQVTRYSTEVSNFLRTFEPIGCRDLSTLTILRNLEIDSYFSGCLTLTFQPKSFVKQDYILAIDLDSSDCDYIQMKTGRRVIRVSNESSKNFLKVSDIESDIEAYLKLIEESWLVVTGRLHGALPAVALNTPVIFISDNFHDSRFGGLIEHMAMTCTKKDLRWIPTSAFNEPLANPGSHMGVASQLRKSVSEFVSNARNRLKYDSSPHLNTITLQTAAGERDSLLAERDSLLAERDSLLAERDSLLAERDSAKFFD